MQVLAGKCNLNIIPSSRTKKWAQSPYLVDFLCFIPYGCNFHSKQFPNTATAFR